jgi:hypothetical protein
MAKSKKSSVNGKLAELLSKLQERLNRVGLESSQTAALVVSLQDENAALKASMMRENALNHSRALAQTNALIALRESTAKAFAQVRTDIESGQHTSGKHGQRLVVVEIIADEALEFKRELRRIVDITRA